MERRQPRVTHRLRDLNVQDCKSAGRDRYRQRDKDHGQNADGYEPGRYRWQRRQKTVVRPAMRIALSGRPHVKQGSPARP